MEILYPLLKKKLAHHFLYKIFITQAKCLKFRTHQFQSMHNKCVKFYEDCTAENKVMRICKTKVQIVDLHICQLSALSDALLKILLKLKQRHELKYSNDLFET